MWNRKLYEPAGTWTPYFEYARLTVIGRLLKIIDAADANEMGPTFERGFVDDLWDRVDGGNPLTQNRKTRSITSTVRSSAAVAQSGDATDDTTRRVRSSDGGPVHARWMPNLVCHHALHVESTTRVLYFCAVESKQCVHAPRRKKHP